MTALAVIVAFVLGFGLGAVQGAYITAWAVRAYFAEKRAGERSFTVGGDG